LPFRLDAPPQEPMRRVPESTLLLVALIAIGLMAARVRVARCGWSRTGYALW
jgi:hypothetical protein